MRIMGKMNQSRLEISEPIKREVRQRCGFGCVICGLPVYHYDHINPWSNTQEHEASNITLLCAQHHDEKTRGRLPTRFVRQSNSHPYNKSHPETAPHRLFYYGSQAIIIAGGNRVYAAGRSVSAIKIDDHSLLDFELVDSELLLNVSLRDRYGKPMLTVRRNELIHATRQWDYTFVGQTLSINEARGQIALKITFNADASEVILEKGLISHNGIEVWFNKSGLCILNNRILLSGSTVTGFGAAISVSGQGEDANAPTAFRVEVDRRPFDRDAAIKWARQQLIG